MIDHHRWPHERGFEDLRLRDLEAHARELGSERELEGVRDILARGNGSDRQLRVFNANRDIVEVVAEIANATEVAAVPV